MAVIGILLAISFSIILELKTIARSTKYKYQKASCAELKEIYTDEMLQDYAVNEWYSYYEPEKGSFPRVQISPILDCFCKDQKKKKGFFNIANAEFTDFEKRTQTVCYDWFLDTYKAKAFGASISVVVNVVNTILKLIIIALITNIGEDTKSAMMRSIMVGVFVTQFFNTAVLLPLSSANLTELNVPIINTYAKGPYTDFTEEWYKDIGALLIEAMIINSIMPVVEFGINWGLKTGFRLLDRSFTKDIYRSKKRSIQLYIDTFSGPEYMIHFRYSTILNVCFVTMMYGTALPILYPIALWSFFVLFTLERLLVCYYYR